MLIEQIIEFEWKGLGPLLVHVIDVIYFFDLNWLFSSQSKNLQGKFFNEYYLLLKILQEAMYLG